MVSVGVRELKRRASELVRLAREEAVEVEITFRGRPVARLVPVRNRSSEASGDKHWRALDVIAADIGRRWPKGVSAAAAVADARR